MVMVQVAGVAGGDGAGARGGDDDVDYSNRAVAAIESVGCGSQRSLHPTELRTKLTLCGIHCYTYLQDISVLFQELTLALCGGLYGGERQHGRGDGLRV